MGYQDGEIEKSNRSFPLRLDLLVGNKEVQPTLDVLNGIHLIRFNVDDVEGTLSGSSSVDSDFALIIRELVGDSHLQLRAHDREGYVIPTTTALTQYGLSMVMVSYPERDSYTGDEVDIQIAPINPNIDPCANTLIILVDERVNRFKLAEVTRRLMLNQESPRSDWDLAEISAYLELIPEDELFKDERGMSDQQLLARTTIMRLSPLNQPEMV
jgi:hypothetical protein